MKRIRDKWDKISVLAKTDKQLFFCRREFNELRVREVSRPPRLRNFVLTNLVRTFFAPSLTFYPPGRGKNNQTDLMRTAMKSSDEWQKLGHSEWMIEANEASSVWIKLCWPRSWSLDSKERWVAQRCARLWNRKKKILDGWPPKKVVENTLCRLDKLARFASRNASFFIDLLLGILAHNAIA